MHRHKPVLKQLNKPFKGKSSNTKNSSRRCLKFPTKTASNQVSKKDRYNQKSQKRKNKIDLTKKKDLNSSVTPILCTIVPFNSYCNPISILKILSEYICNNFQNNSAESSIHGNKQDTVFTFNLDKQKVSICIANYNDIINTLDLIKCSDILFASFGYNNQFQAFDEIGYKLLKSIKLQGQTNTIGIFHQGDEATINAKLTDCEKVFKKSFEMEFDKNTKFFSVTRENDFRNLFDSIQNMGFSNLSLRLGRGYVLSEHSYIKTNAYNDKMNKQLIIRGFIRGVGLSTNFPVHITGFGDFTIDGLHPIETSSSNICLNRSVVPHSNTCNSSDILKNELIRTMTNNIITNEESCENYSNELNGEMKIDSTSTDSCEIESLSQVSNSDLESEISFEHESPAEDGTLGQEYFSDKKTVGPDTICRTRFRKYCGLESLKSPNWNKFVNLPNEYSRIFEVESFKKTAEISRRIYADYSNKENLKGMYCEILLSPRSLETQDLLTEENISNRVIILSSLLPFESKVGVMNFRVKRTHENVDIIKNKTPLVLQAGFRRIYICPIISSCPRLSSSTTIEKNQILKLCNAFAHGDHYVISCYCTIIFPPCPILLFSLTEHDGVNTAVNISYNDFQPSRLVMNELPLAWGDIIDADPHHVILKRIVLTGNLFKVRKCKGIVRNMFYNPEDVKWFKSIELNTKNGIRGVIREPLGTHGYMKCLFNKPIQQNETVCMPIYKRVFPKWFPNTWFESI
ncbi:putative ribosome biogenesis protein tsr1 [Cryptosporidium felis]|nr:putative ribosome biogenesis protein tsr1 [Cryptosporidium felis]